MFTAAAADIIQKSTDSGNFGKPVEFSQYNCVAFQVWWKDLDSTGLFQVQVSVKPDPDETDWVDKQGGYIETVGASGTDINVISNIGEKSVRIVWRPDGVSTGSVSAELMGKDSTGPANFTKEDPLEVTASFTGLRIAGLITEVELSDSEWRPLPATPLANRNALSIQNVSGTNMKINYTDTDPGYTGVQISSGAERFYDITESIVIYGKAQSGNPKIIVEELS